MHRKTAVKEQGWLLFGDWYIHPNFAKTNGLALNELLAHKCSDGSIIGLEGGNVRRSKRKLIRIYGRCRKCHAPVGDEVMTIINMTLAL